LAETQEHDVMPNMCEIVKPVLALIRAGAVAAVILAVIGLSTAPAHAAPEFDPEAIALAERLIQLTGADKVGIQVITFISNQMSQQLKAANPNKTSEIDDFVKKDFIPALIEKVPEMTEAVTKIYAINFTKADLQQIIDFYSSEIGRKVIAKMPEVMQQGMQLGSAWGQRIKPEIMSRFNERLKKQGLKVPSNI
jgi:hypothetical protein